MESPTTPQQGDDDRDDDDHSPSFGSVNPEHKASGMRAPPILLPSIHGIFPIPWVLTHAHTQHLMISNDDQEREGNQQQRSAASQARVRWSPLPHPAPEQSEQR